MTTWCNSDLSGCNSFTFIFMCGMSGHLLRCSSEQCTEFHFLKSHRDCHCQKQKFKYFKYCASSVGGVTHTMKYHLDDPYYYAGKYFWCLLSWRFIDDASASDSGLRAKKRWPKMSDGGGTETSTIIPDSCCPFFQSLAQPLTINRNFKQDKPFACFSKAPNDQLNIDEFKLSFSLMVLQQPSGV